MRVIVDRESVSMGDDVSAHGQIWELPDDTRVGEVIARMAEEFLYPNGSLAWTVEALNAAEVYRSGDELWISRGDRITPCAFVVCRGNGAEPEIGTLDQVVTASAEVRAVLTPTPTGEYAFLARYHARGRPVPLSAYRTDEVHRWDRPPRA